MSRWARQGRACMALALAAAGWAAVTVLAGGFALDMGPLRLTSRDPLRALIVSAILLIAARLALGRVAFHRELASVTGADGAAASARAAGAAALAVLIFSIAWNTRAAGGSDS